MVNCDSHFNANEVIILLFKRQHGMGESLKK